jgi:hypothetical protein
MDFNKDSSVQQQFLSKNKLHKKPIENEIINFGEYFWKLPKVLQ